MINRIIKLIPILLPIMFWAQSPGGVSGPDFWVKSDDAGAIAAAWKDHSINSDNIPNQGGVTLAPADRAHNFHPYTTGYSSTKFFNNTNSALNSTNNYLDPSMRSSVSVFSAVRPTSANGTGRITGIDDDANASEPGISINSGRPHIYKYFGNGVAQANSSTMSTANAFTVNKTSVFSAIQDQALNSGRGERRLGLDGTYETFNLGSTTNTFNVLGKYLRIGYAGWDSPGAFPGDIMEVIWFKRALTANEQSRVNSYLAVKNGITLQENYLSTAGNVIWDLTNNTGYNNNIFGIARDNMTALHQKQSGSANTEQKLVISTAGFADSNAANSTGLANDLQYLLVGDNGLFQGLKSAFIYTAGSNGVTNYRFESIWKVQNTGNVGTVTVAWPKGVKNLYLIQSSDAVFDETDTFTSMNTEVTVNGIVYNTANVTLSDGQFFTFAGFGNAPGGVVGGLSYWYRADKNAVNTGAGTDVTGWTDVWNGTTVAQLGINTLPKYVLGASNYFNFNPGINFTTGTQTLGNNTIRTLTSLDYDVFTLTKEGLASGGLNPRLFSVGMDNTTTGAANWDAFGIWPASTNLERRPYGAGTQYPGVSPAFDAAIPSIMYFKNTNTTSAKGLNGAAMNTVVNYTAVNAQYGGHIFGNTLFSNNGSDNAGFIGHIGETIVYGAGTLTATDRRKVDSYLAIKYGITLGQINTDHYLDTGGNVVWNGTTNAVYNNNIFGIGRDDLEMLEQKVSKSVNAGTILTVATTNDFVNPNLDAARTGFAQDKTYLLVGDNNNTNITLNSITVHGFTGGSRIQRQWLAQPTNAVGKVNFGANLSSYGPGFLGSSPVKMMVADDAAFTTNVEYVGGTYDATSGNWVHTYSFAAGQNKYITYVTVDEISCTTGCNNNTFLNTTDPNSIEYDNMVASESAIVIKEKDGTFKIWGSGAGPTNNPTNNVLKNLLVPTAVTPANGFNYTGTPLKATVAGGTTGAILLTTDGLYGWGSRSVPYTKTTNDGNSQFGKITIDGKADGLPPGISPTNVKMMFHTSLSLSIVTCKGEAWVMNGAATYYPSGDGSTDNNHSIWHRVKISPTQTLDNVVALRGSTGAKIALTADGKLYTWGASTFIGDGTDPVTGTNRAFATPVVIPSGVTPKMIGMTEASGTSGHSYFLLGTNGKLYAMGYAGSGVLGDGLNTTRNTWKEVTATSNGHTLGGNIVWISPDEHGNDTNTTINVLTNDKKQWGWGKNNNYKLGQSDASGTTVYSTPIYMPGNTTNANGMGLNDEIIAVETGGDFTMNYKNSAPYYGFVGLSSYGTIGNGTTGITYFTKYTFNTAILDICGTAAASGSCYKPGILTGTTLDTKMGITALGRAGANVDNWPMVRKGGWLALESKTKAFVPNRVAFSGGNPVGIAPANFVEGMMVYDTTNKCMKMYTSTDDGVTFGWNCISTQTCPD